MLHSGTTVRSDSSEAGFLAHGVVATDRGQAFYAAVWHQPSEPRRLRLDGLDPERRYQVSLVGARPGDPLAVTPDWAAGAVTLPGALLVDTGLPLPAVRRPSALLLHLVGE